jgi:hypothetical protein
VKLASKGLVALTLALAVGSAMLFGFPTALLVLAAGALCLVISLAWISLEKLGGTSELSLDEALALAAPTAAEEQKRAVLRTLKDLEYERSVGKITPEDFEATSAHFRAEAKRLIAEADSSLGTRLERAEARIAKYLAQQEAAGGEPADREAADREAAGREPVRRKPRRKKSANSAAGAQK